MGSENPDTGHVTHTETRALGKGLWLRHLWARLEARVLEDFPEEVTHKQALGTEG